MEQRVHVKFLVKLEKATSETLEMLKTVYDESTVSKSNVFKWAKHFRKGRDMNIDESQSTSVMK
jgi:hypothetical protein